MKCKANNAAFEISKNSISENLQKKKQKLTLQNSYKMIKINTFSKLRHIVKAIPE